MPKKWTKASVLDLPDRDGLQVEEHEIDREDATFIKIVLESGWKDFVSLHKLTAQGKGSRDAK